MVSSPEGACRTEHGFAASQGWAFIARRAAYVNGDRRDRRRFMPRPLLVALLLSLAVAPPGLAAPSTDASRMPAGTYELDPQHASLTARVSHGGFSNYTIRFRITNARYSWDPAAPAAARVEATVDAASFDSGLGKTDADLAQAFLDVRRYPQARFVSTAIAPGDGRRGAMTGELTLHGVTRPVTFDVVWNGYDSGLFGRRSGFSARGTIKRSDFGIDHLLRPPLGFVGDDVELILEVEFVKR
jgi:polyisoprenoid-binding protein YceI